MTVESLFRRWDGARFRRTLGKASRPVDAEEACAFA
jgi:hypothetical protein